MSRIVNLKTVRSNIFNYWYSNWYEDKHLYSSALFEDLNIRTYLSGIFFRLKTPTNYYYLNKLNNNELVIHTDIFLYKRFNKSKFRYFFAEEVKYFNFLLKKNTYLSDYFFNFFIRNHNILKSLNIIDLKHYDILSIFCFYNIFVNNNFFINYFLLRFSYYKYFLQRNSSSFFKLLKHFNTLRTYKSHIFVKKLKYNNFFSSLDLKFLNLSTISLGNIYPFIFNSFYISGTLKNSSHLKFFWFTLKKYKLWLKHILSFVRFLCFSNVFFTKSLIFLFSLLHKLTLNLSYYHFLNKNFYSLICNKVFTPAVSILRIRRYFNFFRNLKNKYYSRQDVYFDLPRSIPNLLMRRFFFRNYFYKFFNIFLSGIENSISLYTKQSVFFRGTIYRSDFAAQPAITNAKIVSDFIMFNLFNSVKMNQVFNQLRKWQLRNYMSKRFLENYYFEKRLAGVLLSYVDHFSYKRYPVLGIRVECSGTRKKGKRKTKMFYGDSIKPAELISKSPNNTFSADLDYYQSFGVLKNGTIGIKVWVFLKTHLYNDNRRFISLIYY